MIAMTMTRPGDCRFEMVREVVALIDRCRFLFLVTWLLLMSRYSTAMLVVCVMSFSLSGCAYDRSFMQMDSNSGVPFFGLQWAVDSGSRPSSHHESSLLNLTEPDSIFNVPSIREDRRRIDKNSEVAQYFSVSVRPQRATR